MNEQEQELNVSDAESSDISMELDIIFKRKQDEREEQQKRQIEEIKEIQRNLDQQQILKEIDKISISYEQIHIFHLKQKGLYNEEEEEIKKKQKFQSIKEINVQDIQQLPIDLNIADQMKQLFEDQILREWENKFNFERFKKICLIPDLLILNKWMFWMILFIKYPTTCSNQSVFFLNLANFILNYFHLYLIANSQSMLLDFQIFDQASIDKYQIFQSNRYQHQIQSLKQILLKQLIDGLREIISQQYTLINTLIPKPKEEFLNPLIFVMTYNCHKIMFEIFFQDRKLFNMRLILDCYHLVLYEINGVLTTDFYIQQTIDKYFSVRFLEYEKATKFTEIQKKKKMLERGREFLGHYLEIPIPQTSDQVNFYQDVKRILSLGKKNLNSHKQGRLQMIRNLNSNRSSSNTSILETESQTSRKQRRSSILGKSPIKNAGSLLSNSPSLNNITGQQINDEPILNMKKGRKKDKHTKYQKGDDIYENISPSLRIKNAGRDIAYSRLRFNLNQVSPTISKQIELKDCTLQDKRKQIIFHPIDRFIKSKDFIHEVEKMKQESLLKQKQIDVKVREQFNLQLINSEQMRLKVLKGNQDMPSMDVISSHSDLSSENSSMQFAKEIMKLKLIPKKKDDELQAQAQRHKMQYDQVRQIKSLIDEQGTKVSELPSTIQLLQRKNSEEQEEEEDQKQKILNILYQKNQLIKKQNSLIQKEQSQIQSQNLLKQFTQNTMHSQPQVSQQLISLQSNTKIDNQAQNNQSPSFQQLQQVKSIKIPFDSFNKSPSQSQRLIPINNNLNQNQGTTPNNQKSQFSNFQQPSMYQTQTFRPQNSGIFQEQGGSAQKIVSQFGGIQGGGNRQSKGPNKNWNNEEGYQTQQHNKIKFVVEEKQKLDSSVQFLVLEQDQELIGGLDKTKRFSSFSPRNNTKNQLKVVKPKEYKDKYNNISYLMEELEDKQIEKQMKRFGMKES